MTQGALSGIRVIDFGQHVSAAFCTKLYADYGAEVIKVEPPEGDMARRIGPFPDDKPDPEKSGLYFFLNTNKRGVTIDHTTEQGRELFLKLVATADMLVENYQPQQMKAWGLDYPTLEKINPNLVMVSITPYGQTGPHANWKGYDLNAYHYSSTGYTYVGRPGQEPLEPGTHLCDMFGAAAATGYGLAAVLGRDKVGGGQHIDVSTTETLAATFPGVFELHQAAMNNTPKIRSGGALHVKEAFNAPGGILPCKDGHVWLLAIEPGHWDGLKKSMGNPEWAADEKYYNPLERGMAKDMIYGEIIDWLKDKNKLDVMAICQSNGVPTTAVFSPTELVKHPHLNDRAFFKEVDHPALGKITNIDAPFLMHACPAEPRIGAPLLGADNDDVLGSL